MGISSLHGARQAAQDLIHCSASLDILLHCIVMSLGTMMLMETLHESMQSKRPRNGGFCQKRWLHSKYVGPKSAIDAPCHALRRKH